ncbi:MAG: hypothetical protein RLZZ203_1050 [Cyanobacteriota bacterium]
MSIFLPPELRIYISSLLLLMILVYILQIEVRNVGYKIGIPHLLQKCCMSRYGILLTFLNILLLTYFA